MIVIFKSNDENTTYLVRWKGESIHYHERSVNWLENSTDVLIDFYNSKSGQSKQLRLKFSEIPLIEKQLEKYCV